jgi:hypothetical protein
MRELPQDPYQSRLGKGFFISLKKTTDVDTLKRN